jgi:hypothetical protein
LRRARGLCLGSGVAFRGGEGGPGQAAPAGGDALLDGPGEALPQVEAVGDLNRARRPGPGAVGVGARPVPADDLHPGAAGRPVGQRLRVAVLDEVQRGAGLDIDEQRAVVLAAPDREVVDPEDPQGRGRRVRHGHDQLQHDLPAGRHGQDRGQPGARPARQRDGDAAEHPGQQRGLPCVAPGQAVDLLGEDLLRAAGGPAGEPPDRQADFHLPSADCGVGQGPGVAAVDPARRRPALRARGPALSRPCRHEQQPGRDGDLLDDHPGQVREENAQVNQTRA